MVSKHSKNQRQTRILSIAICIMLAVASLSVAPGTACAQKTDSITSADKAPALTRQNIETFLNKTKTISTGGNTSLMPTDISDYLNRHIASDSRFSSHITYNIPGYAPQENRMQVDKSEYISHIIQGRNVLRHYTASTTVEDLTVSDNGRRANLQTTSSEAGEMLWPDGEGGQEYLPMKGRSTCRQDITLSENNYIQMAGASCQTTIDFTAQDTGTGPLDKDEFIDDFYDW